MIRSTLTLATLSLAVVLGCGTAAANSQQDKMASCSTDAKTKGLKGDDRKTFMKTCLSNTTSAPAATNSQQEKMKTCNADAKSKGLKGDDRKKFMSDCLKG